MSDSTFVREVLIGSHSLSLLMHNQTPVVELDNRSFLHIWVLNQHFTVLSEPIYIEQFAIIANFLWKGIEFAYIENISHYQNAYKEQVLLEKKCASDIFPYRLTDYKIFDVSVIQSPVIDNGQLMFYVYQISTGLPYRVVCPFPYTSSNTVVHYQILPFQEKAELI